MPSFRAEFDSKMHIFYYGKVNSEPATNHLACPEEERRALCVNPFWVFKFAMQLTCPEEKNHKQKPIQITADSINDHYCSASILCTSIKCSHSNVKIPFRKQSIKHYTLVSRARCLSLSFKGMFKPSICFIHFHFRKNLVFWVIVFTQ